jgi:hypothetical protein
MNRKQNIKNVVAIVFIVALCSSCYATNQTVASGVTLMQHEQQDSNNKVKIIWSKAQEDDDVLVVSGALMRRTIGSHPIWRQVEVTLVGSDGTVLQKARTSKINIPRRMSGRGFNTKRFELRLPGIPPRGSSVRLTVAPKTTPRSTKS